MKLARLPYFIPVLTLISCTPIAPSVHKSILRAGDSQGVIPAASPSPQAAQRVHRDEAESTPIEVRWIASEDGLNQELESANTDLQLRLASDLVQELKTDGKVRIVLPDDRPGKTLAKVRLVIRVQMSQDRLEKQLATDTWDFSWDDADKRTILVTEAASVPSKTTSAIQDALVSIHMVLVDH